MTRIRKRFIRDIRAIRGLILFRREKSRVHEGARLFLNVQSIGAKGRARGDYFSCLSAAGFSLPAEGFLAL
jgi:hypothetical protein